MARTDTLVATTSQDVQGSVLALRQTLEHLDAMLVRVDSLVVGKQAQLDGTVDNVHATSAAVREIAENPWKLVIGRGDGQVAEEMAEGFRFIDLNNDLRFLESTARKMLGAVTDEQK